MGPVQGCLVPGVRNVPSTPSPRHPVRCADQRPRRGGRGLAPLLAALLLATACDRRLISSHRLGGNR